MITLYLNKSLFNILTKYYKLGTLVSSVSQKGKFKCRKLIKLAPQNRAREQPQAL